MNGKVQTLAACFAVAILSSGCTALCGALNLTLSQAENRVSYWSAAVRNEVPGAEEKLLRAYALRAAAQVAIDRCRTRFPGEADDSVTLPDDSVVRLATCSGGITYTRSALDALGPPVLIDFGEELAALEGEDGEL